MFFILVICTLDSMWIKLFIHCKISLLIYTTLITLTKPNQSVQLPYQNSRGLTLLGIKVGDRKKNDFEQAQAFGENILRVEHMLEHFKNIFWHTLKKSDRSQQSFRYYIFHLELTEKCKKGHMTPFLQVLHITYVQFSGLPPSKHLRWCKGTSKRRW